MKLPIILLLLLSLRVSAVERDKVKHFVASSIISSSVQHYTQNWKISSVACISVGVAKEMIDNVFDEEDLMYDVAGCAFGMIAYKSTNYILDIVPTKGGATVNFDYKF